MAIRIPVVISQHERRAGSIADYEEQLITRIVMESRMDATLVADLKSIAIDTTDHLCIEGLKGDFVLATWESPEYVCEHLLRLGISSLEIIPVDGGPKVIGGPVHSGSTKKIFLVALITSDPIDATIAKLKRLLESRTIQVFAIGAPIHRVKPASELAPNPVGITAPIVVQPTFSPLPNANLRVNLLTVPSHATMVDVADESFPNIDQLMDDLDKFEI